MLEHALSLQAQREACEAFISSERHEGWVCLPASYDDGGFSGATMDGLALQRLLADITAGRVDIVVYKTEIACRSKNDPATGGGGRSHQGKMLVVGDVEVEGGGLGPGRIRLSQVADYSAASLHAFLAANLTPGATAKTDGWPGYPGAADITHDPHVVGKMAAHIVLPWVHRIFSNLKVWALGVYHGLRRKHLQSYIDEFVFRFNRRRT